MNSNTPARKGRNNHWVWWVIPFLLSLPTIIIFGFILTDMKVGYRAAIMLGAFLAFVVLTVFTKIVCRKLNIKVT